MDLKKKLDLILNLIMINQEAVDDLYFTFIHFGGNKQKLREVIEKYHFNFHERCKKEINRGLFEKMIKELQGVIK